MYSYRLARFFLLQDHENNMSAFGCAFAYLVDSVHHHLSFDAADITCYTTLHSSVLPPSLPLPEQKI